MISVKAEEKIRRLIIDSKTNRQIAKETKSSDYTIKSVRNMLDKMKDLDEFRIEAVVSMLAKGFPSRAISIRLGIGEDYINAVRRYNYLKTHKANRKSSPHICSVCKKTTNVSRKGADLIKPGTLLSVVSDLIDLDDLNLVSSPLVSILAARAREAIRRHNNEQ